MKTIKEELTDDAADLARITGDSTDLDFDGIISDASSSVFVDMIELENDKVLGALSACEEEDEDSLSILNSLCHPNRGGTDSDENREIEEQLIELNGPPSPSSPDREEVMRNLGEEKKSTVSKYDLSNKRESSSETRKYDLGSTFEDKCLDLGAEDLEQSGTNKHDQYTSMNDGIVTIRSIPDDETRTTQPRSGSSALILHKWLKEKDWFSARTYLISPQRNQKRLYGSVCFKNEDGETALHIACRRRAPFDIVKAIINIGGIDSVMTLDTYGGSLALHHACHFNASLDVIQLLVFVGGEQAVSKKDAIGNLPLHWALSKNASSETVKLLIDMGGNETVNNINRLGWNALHAATYFQSKYSIIKLLVHAGGLDTVKCVNKKNQTALDILYERNPFDKDSISLVQYEMGKDDNMMTWIPHQTIDSTLCWVRSQSGYEKEDSFGSPCIQRVLNHVFLDNRFFAVLLTDFSAQVILVATFSYGVTEDNLLGHEVISFHVFYLLVFSTAWLGVRALMTIFAIPLRSWVGEISNWLSLSQIVLSSWTISVIVNGVSEDNQAALVVLTMGLIWFRLLFMLGNLFYRVAVLVYSLQMIVLNLLSFFITALIVGLGFAHMMHTLNIWESRNCLGPVLTSMECQALNISDSYYAMFSEFVNPGTLFVEESYLNTHVSLIIAISVTGLVLLNILIADILKSFTHARSVGKRVFWQKRFNFIIELGNIYKQARLCESIKADVGKTSEDNAMRIDETIPITRFKFSTAHFELFPGDFYNFRKWWVKNGDSPNFSSRLRYFLAWATVDEILLPGHSFERVLSGKGKDTNSYCWRILLYFICPFLIIFLSLCFIGGFLTFGVFWPRWMKAALFCGVIDLEGDDTKTSQFELIRGEIMSVTNEFKAEKYNLHNLVDDVKAIQTDLKKTREMLSRSNQSSIYTEDELSDIMVDV